MLRQSYGHLGEDIGTVRHGELDVQLGQSTEFCPHANGPLLDLLAREMSHDEIPAAEQDEGPIEAATRLGKPFLAILSSLGNSREDEHRRGLNDLDRRSNYSRCGCRQC